MSMVTAILHPIQLDKMGIFLTDLAVKYALATRDMASMPASNRCLERFGDFLEAYYNNRG